MPFDFCNAIIEWKSIDMFYRIAHDLWKGLGNIQALLFEESYWDLPNRQWFRVVMVDTASSYFIPISLKLAHEPRYYILDKQQLDQANLEGSNVRRNTREAQIIVFSLKPRKLAHKPHQESLLFITSLRRLLWYFLIDVSSFYKKNNPPHIVDPSSSSVTTT